MYKVGDIVLLVSIKFQVGKRLVARPLNQCLLLTKGKLFKPRRVVTVTHRLTITDVIDYGNGKFGYVGFKSVGDNNMSFLLGHCNYPSLSRKNNAEYKWTVYHVKLGARKDSKPEVSHYEDIAIVDKWIKEKIHVNAYLRKIRNASW